MGHIRAQAEAPLAQLWIESAPTAHSEGDRNRPRMAEVAGQLMRDGWPCELMI
jgi:hypothetical protein